MFRNRLGFGLLAALTMSIVLVRAHPEGPGAIEAYLHGLAEGGAITEAQHVHIERLYAKSQIPTRSRPPASRTADAPITVTRSTSMTKWISFS
jgi:hypothetical protein